MNIRQSTQCTIAATSIAITTAFALSACAGQEPAFGLDQTAVAYFDAPRAQRFEPHRDLAERLIGMHPPRAVSSEHRDLAERRIWIDTHAVIRQESYGPRRGVSDR